jgi:hypothetical protein
MLQCRKHLGVEELRWVNETALITEFLRTHVAEIQR